MQDENGETIFWENSCFPLFDSAGEIVAGVEVCRNITERVTLQAQLKKRNNDLERLNREYRSLVDHLPDFIVRYDSELRRTFVNPAWERAAGLAAGEVVGVASTDIPKVSKPINQDYLNNLRLAFATGQPQYCEFEWENVAGELLFLDYEIIPEFGEQGKVVSVLAVGYDLTERRRVEDALCRQEQQARSLLRLSRRLESAQSYAEAVSAARDEVREIVGYTSLWVRLFDENKECASLVAVEGPVAESILASEGKDRLTIHDERLLEELAFAKTPVIVPDARSDPRTDKAIVRKLNIRSLVNIPILLFDRHLGTIGTGTFGDEGVQVPTAAELDYLAALGGHLAVTLDRIHLLNERRQAEAAMRQLNRKLRAVDKCNQVLLRAEDEPALLDEICRIVCEEAGYLLAWVGFAKDDAEKTVEPVSWAGRDSDYVADIRLSWDGTTELGKGPAGVVIRNGQSVLVQDIATDPRMIPWRESALQRGYRAAIALPLKGESQVFGVLLVYSEEPDSIIPDEVELLEGLAANLAYGITVLRNRSARQKAERQISLLSNALNMVHEAAYLIDDQARFYYVNDEACRLLGYSREELLGLNVFDIDPDFTHDRWKETLAELKQQRSLTLETRHRRKDGQIFPVEIYTSYLEVDGEEFDLALARDITERKLMEDALFFVAQRGWLAGTENFFVALAQFLGKSLDLDYVVIDRLAEDLEIAETLALYAKGAVVPNMRYALKGTPCENVMGREMCIYPQGVQQQFPEDALLIEMGVDSYIGIPLWDSFGRPIGLIALMDSQPIPDVKSATQLLQLVATRAAAELERERSDRILRARELEFRTLAENSPDNIARYDADCRTVYVNPALERVLGRSVSEMLGETPREAPRIEEAGEYQDKVAGVLTTGKASEMDLVLPDRGKGVRYHNIRFVAERGDDGKITGVLAIGRDITERKLSEEELRKLSQAIEQSPVSIIITDTAGQIEFVNSKFCEISGYSREEALGQNSRIFKSGETSAAEYQKLWQTISTGGVWSGEFHNLKKNGELFWEHATIAPVRDAQQQITHYVAVKEDITERKSLEEQLHQAQKLESVGQLAGGVAHDFNNMLAVILGRTEMALQQVPPGQPLANSLQEILKAAERSADLTRQLLAFARKQVITPQVIDLNEIMEGMLKMLRRLIGEGIDLAWLPYSTLMAVNMDPTQFDQILVNLCVNARDAIDGEGKITIETHPAVFDKHYCADHAEAIPGEYILLAVSDNGPGMDKSILERIFEPFFTTKGIGRGTGLGLATVYGIVRQNNGFINVYSEPGQGTTFKIYLPRHTAGSVPEPGEDQVTPIARGNEILLLVEDETSILNMTGQMLESCGYQVLLAETPGAALQIARNFTNEIQLLISDVVMPGMNGPELQKQLMTCYPRIRSLFMSGYPTNVIVRHGVLMEGVHFLQKPFALNALAAKVREVLDEQ
jgi:PAS domain S-box-containing protein